jgi:hypothetical protein
MNSCYNDPLAQNLHLYRLLIASCRCLWVRTAAETPTVNFRDSPQCIFRGEVAVEF